jgi:hypothetical protein
MRIKPSEFAPLAVAAAAAASIAVAPIAAAAFPGSTPFCSGNHIFAAGGCRAGGPGGTEIHQYVAGGGAETGGDAIGADPLVPLGMQP